MPIPPLSFANPQEIGLDPEPLARAYKLLDQWTTGPGAPIPGGAILVGRNGKCTEPKFFGRQGPEPDAPPIRRDGLFLLASITKPIVYLAALRLMEQGLLSLNDPVMRYIPEFAAHHKEDTLLLHLFTHTSGLPDMLPNNMDLRREHAPLEKFIQGAIHVTPLFPPGTDCRYQSMGTLIVAEIVQRLTGQTIHEHLKREIFEPLEMTSTRLGSRELDRNRLIRVEERDGEQGRDYGWNSRYWQELGSPWGGLFSSPDDFARICQLLLNGGRLGDVRLLASRTVETMRTNRLHDLPDLPEAVRRTQPWGLGWRLNHPGSRDSWGDTLGPNVFGHTGATGTLCWIDPDRNGYCLIFTTGLRAEDPWRLVHLSNAIAAAFE
jgi:CubicO group peptidase (beta-lactamase class C family)